MHDYIYNGCVSSQCIRLSLYLPVGANVHRMVKAPGGYFSNKEIEQVEAHHLLNLWSIAPARICD